MSPPSPDVHSACALQRHPFASSASLAVPSAAMQQLQLPVLELLMEYVSRCGSDAGAIALEAQARDCFCLSQVQRCNRRSMLQLRGMRSARAAQAARTAMWRERALGLEQRVGEVLDQAADIDEDRPLLHRVRRLLYLRRLDQELIVRIMGRRPSLLSWAMRQQDAIRAVLDAEQEEESEASEEQ